MLSGILVFAAALFVMAASCYLLFITSDPLEKVGGRLGHLLHLPEDVIASTFQALATSGPEITMAILAATAFVAGEQWAGLQLAEKASSGALNMVFSAMSNLLGIGCLGILYMLWKKTMQPEEILDIEPSGKICLLFYVAASGCLSLFLTNDLWSGREIGILTELEAWVLAAIGISFVLAQFFIPNLVKRMKRKNASALPAASSRPEGEVPLPQNVREWMKDFTKNAFIYAALVFALIVFVRACMDATFDMATIGIVSVGGVLIMFTSYVSSFPEFMLTYRYAKAVKKAALMGMLFGSNVIDLAFAGFRAIWLHEPMEIYTTGRMPQLLPVYIWVLPVLAILSLIGLWRGKIKAKYAYPLMVFYIIYTVSGFVLL